MWRQLDIFFCSCFRCYFDPDDKTSSLSAFFFAKKGGSRYDRLSVHILAKKQIFILNFLVSLIYPSHFLLYFGLLLAALNCTYPKKKKMKNNKRLRLLLLVIFVLLNNETFGV